MTARVVFLIRVPAARQEEFLQAYEKVRYLVAEGVPGHLRDQVCQSTQDTEQWLITSEWRDLESFTAWEVSDEHRELVKPMRACFTEARSIRFTVRAETSARTEESTMTETLTDEDVSALLRAVGHANADDGDLYGRSFEELDIDSLARVEMASRIQTRFGVDVEEQLTAELSPSAMQRLVNQRLADGVR